MSQSIQQKNIQEIRDSVERIEMALMGSQPLGIKGLVEKVDEHNVYIDKDKKMKQRIAGGTAVVVFLYGVLTKGRDLLAGIGSMLF